MCVCVFVCKSVDKNIVELVFCFYLSVSFGVQTWVTRLE